MPAVTLAALFCAGAMLRAAKGLRSRRRVISLPVRVSLLGVVVVFGVVSFVGLRGNQAIAASQAAAGGADWPQSADSARSARFWAPWSSQPWQLLGEAQAQMGNQAAARGSFRKALAKNSADWTIWLDLAVSSRGGEQRHAFAQALKLDPLGPEIASWLPPGYRGTATK